MTNTQSLATQPMANSGFSLDYTPNHLFVNDNHVGFYPNADYTTNHASFTFSQCSLDQCSAISLFSIFKNFKHYFPYFTFSCDGVYAKPFESSAEGVGPILTSSCPAGQKPQVHFKPSATMTDDFNIQPIIGFMNKYSEEMQYQKPPFMAEMHQFDCSNAFEVPLAIPEIFERSSYTFNPGAIFSNIYGQKDRCLYFSPKTKPTKGSEGNKVNYLAKCISNRVYRLLDVSKGPQNPKSPDADFVKDSLGFPLEFGSAVVEPVQLGEHKFGCKPVALSKYPKVDVIDSQDRVCGSKKDNLAQLYLMVYEQGTNFKGNLDFLVWHDKCDSLNNWEKYNNNNNS